MEPTDKDRASRRVALNMKASPELRARVEAAAKESGLSIAQEVERRLLISMADDDRAGGLVQGDMIRAFLLIMNGTSRSLGVDWWRDPDGWKIVNANIQDVLRQAEPEPLETPAPFDPAAMERYEADQAEWKEREIYPLRQRRLEIEAEARSKGGSRREYLSRHAGYREVIEKLRTLIRNGGPKPALPPEELARWEAKKARDYRVERAWSKAADAVPYLFFVPDEYDDGY